MRRREFIAGLAGATVACPLAAVAQRPAMPVIGFLDSLSAEAQTRGVESFRQGLREFGYIEGRNVEILFRWAEGRYDRLPALAEDLVRRRVALIVASNGPAPAFAVRSATSTIPIVLCFGSDPVELGLVASLSRPGGNITGVTSLVRELYAKRLEVLHEMVPAAKLIGFLDNPTASQAPARNQEVETAARALGVRLVTLNASTAAEIGEAVVMAANLHINAVLVGGDPFFHAQQSQIVELTSRYSVPAIYAYRDTVDAGGLLSYGTDIFAILRIAGRYVGRILNGEPPGNLPIEQSTKVELAINLKTAKALGLTIPETLLATADEVIQ
jgi:putative tryptophan/tyrosine transport system substrate-binding protein